MSGKLDQSLDTILAARKKTVRPRRNVRRPAGNKPAAAAPPVGGVKKTTKPVKKTEKAAPPSAPSKTESKIMVSNLPSDVTETQIKDYFQQSIAPVKRVLLTYGPNGQSRGIATLIFANSSSASEAVKQLNGVKVDGRPMKVDIIIDGKDAPAPPQPKKLADRISQPKTAAKPKPATATKSEKLGTENKRGRKAVRGRGGKRVGRVKKTAEELDAEMTDYFQQGTGEAPANASGAAPANGDTNMGDDI